MRSESPLKSLKDLLARLKQDSSQVSVAVGSSLGSTNHIAVAMIAIVATYIGVGYSTVTVDGTG